MRALSVVTAIVALACGCAIKTTWIRAVHAEGSTPEFRLWWVDDLLFEAPAGWHAIRNGRTFLLSRCPEPRLAVDAYRYTNVDSLFCPYVAVRHGENHFGHDREAFLEDLRISRARGYLPGHAAFDETARFAGMDAVKETFSNGDRFWLLRGDEYYTLEFGGPPEEMHALWPLFAHVEATARFAPEGAEPRLAGSH